MYWGAIANKTIEEDKDDLIQDETFRKLNKRKCRYYNRGHCKYRERCKYVHSKHICQGYLNSGKYDSKSCADRHPKVCKFWTKSKSGCIRKTSCDFLHETPTKEDHTHISENKEMEMESFRCVSCKGNWTNESFVVKNVIINQTVYFCLNCDDCVKDKSKVLNNNWTMFDASGNLRYDV